MRSQTIKKGSPSGLLMDSIRGWLAAPRPTSKSDGEPQENREGFTSRSAWVMDGRIGCPIDSLISSSPPLMSPKVQGLGRISLIIAGFATVISCDRTETKGQTVGSKKTSHVSAPQSVPESGKSPAESNQLNAEEFLSKLKSVDVDDMRSISGDLGRLTRSDPENTLHAVDALPLGIRRTLALRTVFADFPVEKTGLLVKWAEDSALKEDKQLIGLVLPPDGSSLPQKETFGFLQQAKPGEVRDAVLRYAAYQAAAEAGADTQKARALSGQLPEELRGEFLNEFAYGLIDKEPTKGVSEILANPDVYAESAREGCLESAGKKDPAAVSEMILSSVRKDANSEQLVPPFVKGWLERDSTKAGEWVMKLNGTSKDIAAREVVKFLVGKGNYDEAQTWHDSIVDESIRSSIRVP